MKVVTKASASNFFINNIVYVLALGLVLRIFLGFFGTLYLDQGTFVAWSNKLATEGLKNFYSGWSDYLPGYLYILWLLGKVNLLGFIPQVVLYKLPAIFSDLLTGYLIYKIVKQNRSLSGKKEWMGLVGALVYILNPAIFSNSSLWGQVDSLTALFTVLAIFLFNKNYLLSSASLAVGTLIKPQAAFIFPVIAFMFIKEKSSFNKIFIYCVTGLAIFILGFVPFSNGHLFQFIFNRLSLSASQYPYTSVNAFNFWGILGMWQKDNLIYLLGGYLTVLVLSGLLFVKNIRQKISPYALAAFVMISSFMLFTRIHERHMLPAFAPLLIAAFENPILLIPYAGYSIIYILNLAYSYQWITNGFIEIFPDIFIKILGMFGLGLLAWFFRILLINKKVNWNKLKLIASKFLRKVKKSRRDLKEVMLPKLTMTKRRSQMILTVILSFALVSRVFNLGNPSTMYFDEVYHAFTAKTILHGGVEAWEWWNTPPEGFAYEWTHPPLAKLGMVFGMIIFGENSLGWRLPGAILGTGAVFLIYLIAKKIFDDEPLALISAGVFSLDGLPLVLARIGMNDSYLLFFSLLSIYCFMKEKDAYSALFYGLTLSSKWSALWAAPIIFILWLKRKNKFRLSILWFVFLPFAAYLLSYVPMFVTGHTLETWWGMQKQMWWYHTGLRATHPYTSEWWSWPFMIRPVYLYTSDEVAGFVSRIYAIGNPVFHWFGIYSIAMCAMYAALERNKKLGLVVFSYLIFFVPWAASPRIMFLYHYLPSIPFMAIAIAYILRRNLKIILPYLLICLFAFLYFYPHWAGLSIPLWLDKSYYWINSWR